MAVDRKLHAMMLIALFALETMAIAVVVVNLTIAVIADGLSVVMVLFEFQAMIAA